MDADTKTQPPAAEVASVQEGPGSFGSTPQLQVLVLEEHKEGLYTAARVLTDGNHPLRKISDEAFAATVILAGPNAHFLLLTAQHSDQPLRVPQLIGRLRGRGYDRTINYCAREEISSATRAAYEALMVNHVLVLPVEAQRSVVDALAWLAGQTALDEGGLTILET